MDIEVANKIANSEAIFAILFILVLLVGGKFLFGWIKQMREDSKEREKKVEKLYEEHRTEAKEREKEAKEREQKLFEHLEKSNESQERTSKTLEKIEGNLRRVEDNLSDVWDRIKQIDDKQ